MEDHRRSTYSSATDAAQETVNGPFAPGDTILGKYFVVKLLGHGGMGSVYQVRDVNTDIEYALKYLHSQQTSAVVWRRFDIEARSANKLNHPNLVKVYEVGVLPSGQPYFIMDLVVGSSIADMLKARGVLPIAEALQIMIQVSFAMADAHDSGVVHRDIKPSNIMVASGSDIREGAVKLVDFGIAKITGRDDFNQLTLTRTGEIFGSPLYMSPEQCAGTAIDHRTDIYSFGCVLYEILTGAPPLMADNALTTMIKHQNEKPLSLSQASLGRKFPRALEDIMEKLLEKDPNLRYQNSQELAKELIEIENTIKAGEYSNSELGSGRTNPSILTRTGASATDRHSKVSLKTPTWSKAFIFLAIGLAVGVVCGSLLESSLNKYKRLSVDQNRDPDDFPAIKASLTSKVGEVSREEELSFDMSAKYFSQDV